MAKILIFCIVIISLTTAIMSRGLDIDNEDWPYISTTWPPSSPITHFLHEITPTPPPQLNVQSLIEKSASFPIPFPRNTTKTQTLKTTIDDQTLQQNIDSAYPLIHETTLLLFTSFINQKSRFGSSTEREFYKNLTITALIDRLLTKRAVSFVGPQDEYLLYDGTKGKGKWEEIGREQEVKPLILKNVLSYDELRLSALLSISSATCFVGNGNETEEEGVIIGLIGPRLEKDKVMEYRDIMVTKEQNTLQNGFGTGIVPSIQGYFSGFYGLLPVLYEDVDLNVPDRFIEVSKDKYFDKWTYQRRIALTIDLLLIEADSRAKKQNTTAFVQVVDLGLGSWGVTEAQNKLFLETFIKRIGFFGGNGLKNVGDVCFSSGLNANTSYKSDDKIPLEGHPLGGVTFHFMDRKPIEKLTGSNKGKLLVVSYNWNSNALPGNEFWLNKLEGEGAATALSSQVAELHNPLINTNLCADNLRIVTLKNGLMALPEFIQSHKNDL